MQILYQELITNIFYVYFKFNVDNMNSLQPFAPVFKILMIFTFVTDNIHGYKYIVTNGIKINLNIKVCLPL